MTHFSNIPPVMPPAMKGQFLFNTEADKKSSFIKQHGNSKEGMYCINSGLAFMSIIS